MRQYGTVIFTPDGLRRQPKCFASNFASPRSRVPTALYCLYLRSPRAYLSHRPYTLTSVTTDGCHWRAAPCFGKAHCWRTVALPRTAINIKNNIDPRITKPNQIKPKVNTQKASKRAKTPDKQGMLSSLLVYPLISSHLYSPLV